MGETPQPQQIEITFSPGAGEALAQAVIAVIEHHASVSVPPPPPVSHGPDVEPWRFHSPSAHCDVIAYLDDHNQVRHVPLTRTSDVPKQWRRIYIERRADG